MAAILPSRTATSNLPETLFFGSMTWPLRRTRSYCCACAATAQARRATATMRIIASEYNSAMGTRPRINMGWDRLQRSTRNGKLCMEGKASRGVVFLLGIALLGCRVSPREPVALQYAYSWNEDKPQERALLQRFARQSGIHVTNIPIPEASREYVDLAHKLLES